jgi:alpha-1,2-mannosyltransferase
MSLCSPPKPASPIRHSYPPPIILAVAAVAALYGWAIVATTPAHPGAVGININTLGNEWMVFYGAIQWFMHGHLAALYDGDRFTAYLNATFAPFLSQPMSFRPWVYPPSYLLVVLPFGALPFVLSYLAFQAATAGLLAAALWFGGGRQTSRLLVLCGALLGPPAALNFGAGENAFLTAALLVGGFRLVHSGRPALGGLVLGLLTIKPQFSILAPFALVAAREWRALAGWAAGATLLVAASAALFGLEPWHQWLDLALGGYWQANAKWVEAARVWGTSVYAALLASGLSPRLADAGQAAATLIAAGLTYAAFRRRISGDRQLAVLLAATLLAAPHSSVIDFVLLSIAAMLWSIDAVQQDTSLAQWTLALALWLAMLFNPPLASPPGRLTPLLILAFVGLAMTRSIGPAEASASARTITAAPGAQPPLPVER